VGNIKILPANLVNKIAAGEVIERPASVVKELVENSLDAGADHIHIEIENGGRDLILVRDNGCGMDPGDVQLAFLSHATSKLAAYSDLSSVATMGFRGEALASIGAVAQVTLTSRTPGSLEAFQAAVEGGAKPACSAAGAPEGTSVEVRNIFYNVPARRKFLKSRATESSYISETVTRIAAVHPQVSFHMLHNGRKTLSAPAVKSLRERLGALYGLELAQNLLESKEEGKGLAVRVIVAAPYYTRADRRMQLVFVNLRPVRDRIISRAIEDAFTGYIPPRRNPVAFVYLTVDPSMVDVNIHPTKAQVKFQNPAFVHSAVKAAIAGALASSPRLRQEMSVPGASGDSHSVGIIQAIDDFLRSSKAGSLRALPLQQDFLDRLKPRPAAPLDEQARAQIPEDIPEAKIMQVHNSYIVLEAPDGVTIIDQHALHERIIFEEISKRFRERTIESQRLLLPVTVEVSPREASILEEAAPALMLLGFAIKPGPGSAAFIVHSAPRVIEREDISECVHALLENFLAESKPDLANFTLSAMQTLACKAAVKAGQSLSREEIEMLLEMARRLDNVDTCPHGRPTTVFFPLAELEHRFKRR